HKASRRLAASDARYDPALGAHATNGETRHKPQCLRHMVQASERTSEHSDALTDGGQPLRRQHSPHALERPIWRYRAQLSQLLACFAPPNREGLNSPRIHGPHVPVEEPSTASNLEVAALISFRQPVRRVAPARATMSPSSWVSDIFATLANYLRFDPSDRCNSAAAPGVSISTVVGGLP